jgi:hypothetical protein
MPRITVNMYVTDMPYNQLHQMDIECQCSTTLVNKVIKKLQKITKLWVGCAKFDLKENIHLAHVKSV